MAEDELSQLEEVEVPGPPSEFDLNAYVAQNTDRDEKA
jgi:hypothetical protein